jgi:hypothetical protein
MRERNFVFKRCSCRNPISGESLGVGCPRLSDDRHGSWYFSLELPAGRDGGRQRMRRGGFGSREAAEQARAYLLGKDVDPDRALVTTGQWLDLWLELRTLSFSTHRIYAQHIRDYIKPPPGMVPLRKLTTGRVQAMITCLTRTLGAKGKPLSPATLHKVRGVLHAALNGAIRRGLIERNPAHWVELPPARRPKAVVRTQHTTIGRWIVVQVENAGHLHGKVPVATGLPGLRPLPDDPGLT